MSSVQDSGSQDTDSDIIQPVVDCYSSFITVRCTASDSDVDRFQAKIVTAAATLLSYSCNTSQKHFTEHRLAHSTVSSRLVQFGRILLKYLLILFYVGIVIQ